MNSVYGLFASNWIPEYTPPEIEMESLSPTFLEQPEDVELTEIPHHSNELSMEVARWNQFGVN